MFTIFDEEEGKYITVEEPDPSLSYTYADYLSWNFKERLELFRGRIYRMGAAPNTMHQVVGGKLFCEFYNFLKGKTCKAFIAPFDVRLPVRNRKKDHEITSVVQPDVCVVCDQEKIDARGCCGAPDLVVEILSPGNTKKEVRIKFELYQEAGVKEYWLINPVEENIIVHLLSAGGRYETTKMYAGDDDLKSASVEGFGMIVNEIFSN